MNQLLSQLKPGTRFKFQDTPRSQTYMVVRMIHLKGIVSLKTGEFKTVKDPAKQIVVVTNQET